MHLQECTISYLSASYTRLVASFTTPSSWKSNIAVTAELSAPLAVRLARLHKEDDRRFINLRAFKAGVLHSPTDAKDESPATNGMCMMQAYNGCNRCQQYQSTNPLTSRRIKLEQRHAKWGFAAGGGGGVVAATGRTFIAPRCSGHSAAQVEQVNKVET